MSESGNMNELKSGGRLERILNSGRFAATSELGPPKSADAEHVRKSIEMVRGYADAYNLTDNQTAIVRLSSLATAVMLLEKDLEPVMQMVTRDRNRIAMQSDILGAAALGVKNILCLTGDHQKFGNHPDAKNVFDLDSIQLVQMVKKMRDEKKLLCDEEMDVEPRMFIGAAANPFADPFEYRVLRLQKKINAGADFIQTQGIFDLERFERYMEMVRERGLDKKVHILAGVIPVKSVGAARYMKRNVSGMMVPDEIITRLKSASDVKKEGIKICVETIERVKEIKGVHGVHIMPIMWEEKLAEIVTEAGLYPRPDV